MAVTQLDRRDTVEADLRQKTSALLTKQAKEMETGEMSPHRRRLLVYYDLLRRCLPYYTEAELLHIQRLTA